MAKIEYVKTSTLKIAGWNPVSRTANVLDLIESMSREGFWEYEPLLIGSDNIIADGNRRYTAAVACGFLEVPVIRTGKPAQIVWAEKDSMHKRINGAQWVNAIANGLDISQLNNNSTMFRNIRLLQELGEDSVKYCSDHGISATAMQSVNVVCNYLSKSDIPFRKKVLRWLIDKSMIRPIMYAIADGVNVKDLLRAIETGKEIKHRWSLK